MSWWHIYYYGCGGDDRLEIYQSARAGRPHAASRFHDIHRVWSLYFLQESQKTFKFYLQLTSCTSQPPPPSPKPPVFGQLSPSSPFNHSIPSISVPTSLIPHSHYISSNSLLILHHLSLSLSLVYTYNNEESLL